MLLAAEERQICVYNLSSDQKKTLLSDALERRVHAFVARMFIFRYLHQHPQVFQQKRLSHLIAEKNGEKEVSKNTPVLTREAVMHVLYLRIRVDAAAINAQKLSPDTWNFTQCVNEIQLFRENVSKYFGSALNSLCCLFTFD